MSDVDKCFSYVFVWHSMVDAKSCFKCVALNGREYRDQDLFANVLIDPQFGPIWDLDADRSLMHGASGTCRCFLEVRAEFDWSQHQPLLEFKSALREFGFDVE